ncbi:Protein required for attachment to host cells [Rhodovulum sp. ES.010]|uniref:host attachment protein n=1 Tax=Rhodovulum sp. ES.010 TaxID=1882821 RepID=UPI00092BF0BC|nr:host attachment protein [Rhodovulum sp. ES.010]SIO37698.1 Protein required for attachment to host cells [Rhodovulum sp. ES.010]
MKPLQTLVLLANEREAQLLVNLGPNKGLTELLRFDAAQNIEYSDQRGREQGGPDMGGHSYQPPTSPREQNREAFADDVLKVSLQEWERGDFTRFVMSAPPKMLGELRNRLAGPLKGALAADMDKDIVGVATDDLPRHFKDVIVF